MAGGVAGCREECKGVCEVGERRRACTLVRVDGGKDPHPLYPTTAQRSASGRLIQSHHVWTPSPINPGMWRWWMWAINPAALTRREQHGEPWENVSAPGKCQRGPGVRRGWWREGRMATRRDESCREGGIEKNEWAASRLWERGQIVVTEFTVTPQWFSCRHAALNSCCLKHSTKSATLLFFFFFSKWRRLNVFLWNF